MNFEIWLYQRKLWSMLLCIYINGLFYVYLIHRLCIFTYRTTAFIPRTSFICIFPYRFLSSGIPKKIMVYSMYSYYINYSFHLLHIFHILYLHITFYRKVKRFCRFIAIYFLRLSQIKECWVRLGSTGAIYERNTKGQSKHDPKLAPQRN